MSFSFQNDRAPEKISSDGDDQDYYGNDNHDYNGDNDHDDGDHDDGDHDDGDHDDYMNLNLNLGFWRDDPIVGRIETNISGFPSSASAQPVIMEMIKRGEEQ